MTKSALALLTFVAANSYADAYTYETVYAEGHAFTKNEAMVYAQEEVSLACRRLSGITTSTRILNCSYLGAGHTKCTASAVCAIPTQS